MLPVREVGLQLLWETEQHGKEDPGLWLSTLCQSIPYHIIRTNGFSGKYFNCLPYCSLKKYTAQSPPVTAFLSKQHKKQRLLREKGAGPRPRPSHTRWRGCWAARHAGSCSLAAGPRVVPDGDEVAGPCKGEASYLVPF